MILDMEHNKLTWTTDKRSGRTVMTDACARRHAAQERAALCELLGCPFDSCYTTGELMRDAVKEGLVSKL